MTALGLLLTTLAAAAGPQSYALTTDLPVWDIATENIDGSGGADVLALCSDPESRPLRKQLAVFLDGSGGAYSPRASFTLTLEPDTGGVFLAEVTGQPPRELVVTDSSGAQVYAYADGAFKPQARVAFNSLLPSRVKKPAFFKKNAIDLNGDGIEEWLIPVSGGYEIRTAERLVARTEADVISAIDAGGDATRITHRLPSHQPFQLPDQSAKGIVFLSEEYADFAYGDNWAQHRRYKIPLDLKEKWVVTSQMEDIDNNGLPDLIVTQTQGTINLKVLTQIYLAKEPFTFSQTPDDTFEVSGALTSPLIKDVDGDGHSDLLFIKVPFGVKLFVSYFVAQKLPMQVEAHLLKDGRFGATPDLRASITVDAPENRKRVAYAMGDFSGDGRIDVAFGSGTDALVVHVGEPDRLISVKPWQTLAVPAVGEARAVKLDANSAEDLVLFHPATADEKRIDVTVF